MAEEVKNVKFSKKKFFMNFKDMMSWISLDENTSLGSVLNNVSCSEDLYSKQPPSFCSHRRKNTFFIEFLSFKLNFRMLRQQEASVDQHFYMTKKPKFYPTKH